MSPQSAILALALTLAAPPAPPVNQIAAALDVHAKLIPHGDLVVLALDVNNGNAKSAVVFADADVELVDRAGAAHTTEPLHPLITLQMQRQLFDATHGTYYQGLHTIDNVIHGGNPDHFLGVFKKADFVSGRVKVRYYVPDYDQQPVIQKDFRLGN